ncbi:TOMM precursor leader peptide-binding protein [Nonomuraea sp. NPDC050394]|uniref:TOMM precursor leader peptide-binding protein n=1 Tax=Nonomuraea sp. NPDC050394 TaxID=3364363 RepID=UPI0037A64040
MSADRPIAFKRHLRAETVPGEGVFLVSARGAIALSGTGIDRLAPLLNGTRNVGELERELAPEVPARRLGHLLDRLADADLIAYRSGACGGARAAYWDLAGLDADEVATGLAARPVALTVLGNVDPSAAARACREAGLVLGGPAAFPLVLCDDYLDARLAALNARHLEEGRPWLLAKPTGADVWVGPFFEPGHGPCLACLAARLGGRRMVESYLQRAGGHARPCHPPETSLPATTAIGLQAAVLEAAKWLAGHRHPGQRAVWTLNTLTLESARHPVARRPQCPACGDPEPRPPRPVRLRSRPKAAGEHRALAPELMWERHAHLADPLTGVVERVRRDPRAPGFLHCYLSGPNLAMAAGGLPGIRAGLRRHSGGKGATDLHARVSALCEAVERHCGSRLGEEFTLRDSLAGLGPQAVHPNEVMLFHERQYRDRERWNAGRGGQMDCQFVPEPFDEHAPVEWTPLCSLVTGEQRLLPTQLLYYHGVRQAAGPVFARADSNGNAAGASLEDALVQGFLELVERDAVAQWWYNRTRHPGVDLHAFGDPAITGLAARYRELHREIWVLDLTSDLGVPVMAAVSRRTGRAAEDVMLGFGAHFDPRVAVSRALAEHGQLLPAVLDSRPDGTGYGAVDPRLAEWWARARVGGLPYLLPDPGRPRTGPADHPHRPRADLRADVGAVTALARRHGLDVLVLDQTRPDIGLPVVKVVVPGLRHFWARFAPGRLYDAPVRAGRLAEPTPYERLNPVPLFL